MKVLVIQIKMIGDVLASSIICNNLKQIYPDAQIDYLINNFTRPVVENNPNIDNLIIFEEKYQTNKLSFLKFLIKFREENYDIVIDAYCKLESKLVVFFSGAKVRIGYNNTSLNFIYNNKVDDIKITKMNAGYALENRLNLLSPLSDTGFLNIKPKIFFTENEILSAKKKLINHNIDFSKKLYMIGVLGSGNNKTYPFDYMAKVLDFIVENSNASLLFNYMPSQKKEAKVIFDLCKLETRKNIKINVVPGSIREFLSIAYHCDALIGNEGGAINMAKAIDKPTFTIFSPWINKISWNSFEDGKKYVSIHLKDLKPELYGNKSAKEMKDKAIELYKKFEPKLIFSDLLKYLTNN
jgi:ADP-heptose:LPS heptosyltransferase